MLKELGFSTQIKDLTVVITYASVVKLKGLVEAIQKTDGGAMTFTYFNEGFRMNYDKDNYKLIIKTFKYPFIKFPFKFIHQNTYKILYSKIKLTVIILYLILYHSIFHKRWYITPNIIQSTIGILYTFRCHYYIKS